MRSLLTAAAISLAFTLFLTPVFLRLFRKWGWGQVIRTPDDVHNPSHGEKRGTPTMGGTIFIVGTIVGYLVGAYTGNNPPDHLGLARGVDDGRLRRGRLHRRLHEGAGASAASA